MISSVQVKRQISGCSPAIATFISRWKVAGALHNSNGITLNRKVPRRVTNVVLSSLWDPSLPGDTHN